MDYLVTEFLIWTLAAIVVTGICTFAFRNKKTQLQLSILLNSVPFPVWKAAQFIRDWYNANPEGEAGIYALIGPAMLMLFCVAAFFIGSMTMLFWAAFIKIKAKFDID